MPFTVPTLHMESWGTVVKKKQETVPACSPVVDGSAPHVGIPSKES